MGDWLPSQEFHLVTIHTASSESLGYELNAFAAPYSGSGGSPSATRAFFIPFLVYRPSLIVRLNWLNGGTIGDNVDVGVYDEWGKRLCSGGGVAQVGTNTVQSFDITDTWINPGSYYMALAVQGTTGFIGRFATGVVPTNGAFGVLQMDSAYPLPDPVTYAAPTALFIPIMGVSMRSLL